MYANMQGSPSAYLGAQGSLSLLQALLEVLTWGQNGYF